MGEEPLRREETDPGEARADFVAEAVVIAARWLQLAAAIWLGLRLYRAAAIPPLVGTALFGLSWIAMIGGTVVTATIAYLRPKLRRELSLTLLLWFLLGFLGLGIVH